MTFFYRAPAWVTALCTAVLTLFGSFILLESWTEEPYQNLERPVTTTIITHESSLTWAANEGSSGIAGLQRLLFGAKMEVAQRTIRGYEDLLAWVERPGLPKKKDEPNGADAIRARLALLHAEGGNHERADNHLAKLDAAAPHAAHFIGVLRFAYGWRSQGPSPNQQQLREALAFLNLQGTPQPDAWSQRRLVEAFERRLGQTPRTQHPQRCWQAVAVLAIYGSVLLAGGILVILTLFRRQFLPRLASGISAPPWTLRQAYVTSVRTAVLGIAATVAVVVPLTIMDAHFDPMIEVLAYAAMGLPLFLYLPRNLLHPHGLTLRCAYGLGRDARRGLLVTTTLQLAALDWLVMRACAALFGSVGAGKARLTETTFEAVLYGSTTEVLGYGLLVVVLAPLIEEIGFRGVVYTSLRAQLKVPLAAAASAGLFTIVHGYSLQGTIALFGVGLLWAMAYERTRSLWPAIFVHALNNALVFVDSVLRNNP